MKFSELESGQVFYYLDPDDQGDMGALLRIEDMWSVEDEQEVLHIALDLGDWRLVFFYESDVDEEQDKDVEVIADLRTLNARFR